MLAGLSVIPSNHLRAVPLASSNWVACPKKFDPTAFMGEGWSAVEEDERADDIHEIDVSAIALVTCLKTGDQLPTGEECLRRLKGTPNVRLAGRAFLALWENQSCIPEDWKKPFTFVFFDGLVLGHRNGNRYSLHLSWHDDRWHWYSGWLGNTRSASSLSAVLAK